MDDAAREVSAHGVRADEPRVLPTTLDHSDCDLIAVVLGLHPGHREAHRLQVVRHDVRDAVIRAYDLDTSRDRGP